eukprot:gene10103-2270_t
MLADLCSYGYRCLQLPLFTYAALYAVGVGESAFHLVRGC